MCTFLPRSCLFIHIVLHNSICQVAKNIVPIIRIITKYVPESYPTAKIHPTGCGNTKVYIYHPNNDELRIVGNLEIRFKPKSFNSVCQYPQQGENMSKIMHAQMVIVEDDLTALKEKTGEKNTKDALAKAVAHYLECEYTQATDMWEKKLEKRILAKKQK